MTDTPAPPAPTNPAITAAQQQQLNLSATEDSQAASNVNQVTPQGTLTYKQTGTGPDGIPTYTATQQLAPGQQGIFNALTGAEGTAASQAGSVLGNANYGAPGSGDLVGDTNSITNQLLGNETNFLNPFFATQSSQLDTRLRNQGLSPGAAGDATTGGGTAYGNAMRDLQTTQDQNVSGFLAQAEPMAFNQAVSQYQLPASTAAMLESLSGGTPAVNSSLTGTPQASEQPANLIGATANANQIAEQSYAAQLQNNASMNSGIFGALGAIGGGIARNPALAAAL